MLRVSVQRLVVGSNTANSTAGEAEDIEAASVSPVGPCFGLWFVLLNYKKQTGSGVSSKLASLKRAIGGVSDLLGKGRGVFFLSYRRSRVACSAGFA